MVRLLEILLVSFGCVAPSVARELWATKPATLGPPSILTSGYPIGNGKLGAIPFGRPGSEKILLNVDSLWTGGPFETSSYSGGNPATSKAAALSGIRSTMLQKGTGDVNALLGGGSGYGSYRVLGNLAISFGGVSEYSGYKRRLDLDTGIHTTSFVAGGSSYNITTFCSYPDQGCVYGIEADGALPSVSVGLEGSQSPSASCSDGYLTLTGKVQANSPQGMKYDVGARLVSGEATSQCSSAVLTITPSPDARSLAVFVTADTNYDQTKGNPGSGYSFQGPDPGPLVEATASAAAAKSFSELLAGHVADYEQLVGGFSLNLPDTMNSAGTETPQLISQYKASGTGDPFLEAALFDFSRHLLVSSSRNNSLPANLQGRWTEELSPAWSSDYHANINLQMNYWVAAQTGLVDPQVALWNHMEQTWMPRGAETAKLLYDAPGFVVHNEMNIFGYTAMKNAASWANYPAAAAWMMQHVWDNFDYTQDEEWLRKQGYPLMKGVAEFWLSQLQKDTFSNDDSLVVVPCNSPEHGPTTFGCAHDQQLVHQVFEAVLSSADAASETDASFLDSVSSALTSLDKGIHVASWGGLKEWKLPGSYGFDKESTHRHLSHLVGWYPGYSVSSFADGYRDDTLQAAVRAALKARGTGIPSDCNCGWSKVWRSACWARLNETTEAHMELRLAIGSNFAPNGLSMYSGTSTPFQIDANLGLGGAVLSMLVVDLPLPFARRSETRTVVLGPAIPAAWGKGSVKGLRLRGGGSVDFEWDAEGLVTKAVLEGREMPLIVVDKLGSVLAQWPASD